MRRHYADSDEELDTTPAGDDHPARVANRVYTPVQMGFLNRLERLKAMRGELDASPEADSYTLKLIGRGLFATYHECVDHGVADEARRILQI